MSDDKDDKDKDKLFSDHQMEEIFGIESGSTEQLPAAYDPKAAAPIEMYDVKDKEIEDQYQEIFNAAMLAFHEQSDSVDVIDPKYRARAQEVAANFLNTALQSVNSKAGLKQTKEKHILTAQKNMNDSGKNDTVIFDRNELLKAIREKRETKTIDASASTTEVDESGEE